MTTDKHLLAESAIKQKFGLERSPEWENVQQSFRGTHPQCSACGEGKQLNVHHIYPFHYVVTCGRPDLELDSRNLMTLCTRPDCEHHLLLGHMDDFESYNPEVCHFIVTYRNRSNQQIRNDAAFQAARACRPKHLEQMSGGERVQFKQMLDRNFPPVQPS